jgi:hypothetical protein
MWVACSLGSMGRGDGYWWFSQRLFDVGIYGQAGAVQAHVPRDRYGVASGTEHVFSTCQIEHDRAWHRWVHPRRAADLECDVLEDTPVAKASTL